MRYQTTVDFSGTLETSTAYEGESLQEARHIAGFLVGSYQDAGMKVTRRAADGSTYYLRKPMPHGCKPLRRVVRVFEVTEETPPSRSWIDPRAYIPNEEGHDT